MTENTKRITSQQRDALIHEGYRSDYIDDCTLFAETTECIRNKSVSLQQLILRIRDMGGNSRSDAGPQCTNGIFRRSSEELAKSGTPENQWKPIQFCEGTKTARAFFLACWCDILGDKTRNPSSHFLNLIFKNFTIGGRWLPPNMGFNARWFADDSEELKTLIKPLGKNHHLRQPRTRLFDGDVDANTFVIDPSYREIDYENVRMCDITGKLLRIAIADVYAIWKIPVGVVFGSEKNKCIGDITSMVWAKFCEMRRNAFKKISQVREERARLYELAMKARYNALQEKKRLADIQISSPTEDKKSVPEEGSKKGHRTTIMGYIKRFSFGKRKTSKRNTFPASHQVSFSAGIDKLPPPY